MPPSWEPIPLTIFHDFGAICAINNEPFVNYYKKKKKNKLNILLKIF